MYPRANQSPQSISLTTKKPSGNECAHGGVGGSSRITDGLGEMNVLDAGGYVTSHEWARGKSKYDS